MFVFDGLSVLEVISLTFFNMIFDGFLFLEKWVFNAFAIMIFPDGLIEILGKNMCLSGVEFRLKFWV